MAVLRTQLDAAAAGVDFAVGGADSRDVDAGTVQRLRGARRVSPARRRGPRGPRRHPHVMMEAWAGDGDRINICIANLRLSGGGGGGGDIYICDVTLATMENKVVR